VIIQRAAKFTLDISSETLMPTIKAYTRGFNRAARVGYPLKRLDANVVHIKTYTKMRYYLPSQLAVSARCKAVECLKSLREHQKQENYRARQSNREPKIFKCPRSRQMSIRYDARSYNVWLDKGQVSLLTTKGRIKVSFSVPRHFQQYLSWRRCSADLMVRKNKVFLHVVFEKDIAQPESNGTVVGLDRGINNVAVISNNRFHGGKRIQRVKKRYQRLRAILQGKKHSGKRHLVRMSHRENRFMRDANHCVSKRIVSELKSGDTIVLEDLTGIRRNKTKKKEKNKHRRKKVNAWSFFQFEQFLTYKSLFKGIGVAKVAPCWTSQECSRCGHVAEGNRITQSLFSCEECHHSLHADLNASRVIASRFFNSKEARSPSKACRQSAKCQIDEGFYQRPLCSSSRESSKPLPSGGGS